MSTIDSDLDAIRTLNLQMHVEEKRGAEGVTFFGRVLDQALRFRRANGAVVTRDEFLIGLANPDNHRDAIELVGPLMCEVYENTAIASALLRVEGRNGTAPVNGLFRNIRIFSRPGPGRPWTLHIWFNDRVEPTAESVLSAA
jgi:Domain of unknown function (DUF4440)